MSNKKIESWDDPLPEDYQSVWVDSISINTGTCRQCGNRTCSCQAVADEREYDRVMTAKYGVGPGNVR